MRLRLRDVSADFLTDHGVFSYRRIDPGTHLLLESGPPPTAMEVSGDPARNPPALLDLGCGYGPIALMLALRAPSAVVWAVDVNRRALHLTSRNTRQVADRVRVAAPEDVPAELGFDAIFSNPPVRIGSDALHALLSFWLGRLLPGGLAALVVHKNMGAESLERWLAKQGWDPVRWARKAGYRVIVVEAPSQPSGATGRGGPRRLAPAPWGAPPS